MNLNAENREILEELIDAVEALGEDGGGAEESLRLPESGDDQEHGARSAPRRPSRGDRGR